MKNCWNVRREVQRKPVPIKFLRKILVFKRFLGVLRLIFFCFFSKSFKIMLKMFVDFEVKDL